MGRKAIERTRKPLTSKAKVWVRELVPLLQDRSLKKLTLDELAELAGKSKSTIYTYFSTKEELYNAMIRCILDELDDVVSDKALEGEDVEQIYRSLLVSLSKGIEGLSIQFMEEIQLYFPEGWAMIEAFASRTLANFECIYRRGMESGTFKPFNISLLTALDNHFVMSIMTNTAQFTDQGLSFNDVVTEYMELRLSALKA